MRTYGVLAMFAVVYYAVEYNDGPIGGTRVFGAFWLPLRSDWP